MKEWLVRFAVKLSSVLVIGLPFGVYFFLRFGPKRCPRCRKLAWGVFGPPIGIRRMHFHCKNCGTYFEGHRRLPL
jgi:hypothetical protein